MLLQCSERQDFSEWDRWRKKFTGDIFLEGAQLAGACLKRVDLNQVHLSHACLEGADFQEANLQRTWLCDANLKDASIQGARLQGANMIEACLLGANVRYAFLKAANLHHAFLQGANFPYAVVDGETLLDTDKIDQNTNFASVGLTSARLKPGLADSLLYNIRKKRWAEWYDQGNIFLRLIKKSLIQPFWLISDYDRSTSRIILIFISLVLVFALIYWMNPEMIHNLEPNESFCKLYRTLYFSTVTMITLGFGNMNAHPDSFWGNTMVSFQIISGYVILAALVTRISMLFNSGGPALALRKTRRKFS